MDRGDSQLNTAVREKVSFLPFCLPSNALQGKSNFIMAGVFQCQKGMKEGYSKAKGRLVPDIMVAAAEWRTDSFHPWKNLHKEQDKWFGPPGLAKEAEHIQT